LSISDTSLIQGYRFAQASVNAQDFRTDALPNKYSSYLPIISEEVYSHSGKGNVALAGELYKNIRVY
jgi:hypothetical protein